MFESNLTLGVNLVVSFFLFIDFFFYTLLMFSCFSFGFSEKSVMNGRVPVGLYGNGFKSGSMRLGKDAIVFTKNGETMSVGLLSQTFLEATKAEHVMVPIVTFNNQHILSAISEWKVVGTCKILVKYQ